MQEGHPASETIQERLRELGELWDELQANSRRKAAMLQVVCEVGSVCQATGQRRRGVVVVLGLSPMCPPHILP